MGGGLATIPFLYEMMTILEQTYLVKNKDLKVINLMLNQVLGYLCWSRKKSWRDLLPEYDTYLEDYVYEKIWSELSEKDQNVLRAMSGEQSSRIENIREKLNMTSNNFTVYRNRLLKKGLVTVPGYGQLEFALPRFRQFVERS